MMTDSQWEFPNPSDGNLPKWMPVRILAISAYICYTYIASKGGRKMIKAEVLAEYPHIPTNIDPEIFLFF